MGATHRLADGAVVSAHIVSAPHPSTDLINVPVSGKLYDAKTSLADSKSSSRLLRQDLNAQLKKLDVKENNLLDMAAAGELAERQDPATSPRHRPSAP